MKPSIDRHVYRMTKRVGVSYFVARDLMEAEKMHSDAFHEEPRTTAPIRGDMLLTLSRSTSCGRYMFHTVKLTKPANEWASELMPGFIDGQVTELGQRFD